MSYKGYFDLKFQNLYQKIQKSFIIIYDHQFSVTIPIIFHRPNISIQDARSSRIWDVSKVCPLLVQNVLDHCITKFFIQLNYIDIFLAKAESQVHEIV